VKEGDPLDLVAEKIVSSFDNRFRLNFAMLVEMPWMEASEIRRYREEGVESLRWLEKKLRKEGYEVKYDIVIADPLKEGSIIENLREDLNKSDVIVLFSTRKRRFGLMGEALPEMLSERYPGKVTIITLGEI